MNRSFRWNETRELAAKLVAEGDLIDAEIAAQVGVAKRTLGYWKAHPEFQARVSEHVQNIRTKAEQQYSLVRRLNLRARLLAGFEQILDERGKEPAMAKVPGGKTGLVIAKLIDKADGEKTIVEHYADTGLASEIRIGLREFAQEIGQWANKHEVTGKDGQPIKTAGIIQIVMTPEQGKF